MLGYMLGRGEVVVDGKFNCKEKEMEPWELNNWLVRMMIRAEKIAGEYLCAAVDVVDYCEKRNIRICSEFRDMDKVFHYARLTNRIGEWLTEV